MKPAIHLRFWRISNTAVPRSVAVERRSLPAAMPLIALVVLLAFWLLVACGATAAPSAAETPPELFNPAPGERSCAIDGNPRILRERCVTANLEILQGMQPGEAITLNLFPDRLYTAILDSTQPTQGDGFVWSGHVAGATHSQVTLVVGGGQLTGNVSVEAELFEIRFIEDPVYAIYQIDPAAFPAEAEPIESPP